MFVQSSFVMSIFVPDLHNLDKAIYAEHKFRYEARRIVGFVTQGVRSGKGSQKVWWLSGRAYRN